MNHDAIFHLVARELRELLSWIMEEEKKDEDLNQFMNSGRSGRRNALTQSEKESDKEDTVSEIFPMRTFSSITFNKLKPNGKAFDIYTYIQELTEKLEELNIGKH